MSRIVIVGKILAIKDEVFVDKESGKETPYISVSVLDEDAFSTASSVLRFTATDEAVKGLDYEKVVSKPFEMRGVLTSNFGKLKVKLDSMTPIKAE